MSAIPPGWTRERDGSYSPPKTAKQINAGKIGEVILDAGSAANPAPQLVGASDALPARVEFKIRKNTDEEKLNKTEKAYLAYLRGLNPQWLGIQNLTLKLGDDTRYTPDFVAIDSTGVFHAREVKGFFRDDAKVKIKVAARQFPWIRFTLAFKNGSGWKHEEVKI
jgi:hypothetical protein